MIWVRRRFPETALSHETMGCQQDTGALDLEESERYKSLMEGMGSAIQEMKAWPHAGQFIADLIVG